MTQGDATDSHNGHGSWVAAGPGSESNVQQLQGLAPVPLPAEYLAFLRRTNGGEGELRVQPHWLVIWAAEDVVQFNRDYGVEEHVPGFFAFGSSGGGEMFAFDTRHGFPYPVVAIPFIPMDVKEARLVAPGLNGLLQLLGRADLD